MRFEQASKQARRQHGGLVRSSSCGQPAFAAAAAVAVAAAAALLGAADADDGDVMR